MNPTGEPGQDQRGTTPQERWPALPFEEWTDTLDTLHMWVQMVGKVKLELNPFWNEWWEVALYLTSRGLTTSLIPNRGGVFEINFDFIDHNLIVSTGDGGVKEMSLYARPVADFYREFMSVLDSLEIQVDINTRPTEVPHPIPFDRDEVHASYDPESVNRWWRVLIQTEQVLQRYRSGFVGKSSPIQFFWGSFDLNHTRFSGRPANPPEGPRFLAIAEDQENFATGFWPGNATVSEQPFGRPAFFSYAYPAPAGIEKASIRPAEAQFDPALGEFILLYDDVRKAPSPEQAVLDFFQSTYEAGATLGGWNRDQLEKAPPQ